MIEKENAIRFIEDRLKIENFEAKVKNDRKKFLNELMRSLQAEVPFHNIWLLKNPHMPSEQEVLEDSLNMKGGLCFHFNYFIFHLLKALDFEVYLIYGTYSASPFPEAHMACIIKNMEYEGSRHLVDIGGYPMFEALSLLDLPKVYVYTGRQVMFTKSSAKGRYIRWHSKKDVVVAKEVRDPSYEGEWCKIFDYNDKEVDYSHFQEFTYPIFTDFHPENKLLHNLYLTRYPGRKSATISIIGRRLFKTNDNGFGTVSLLKKGELYPTVRKYFPEISEDDLKIAIKKTEKYLDCDKMNSWVSVTLALLSYFWYRVYYFMLKSSFKRVAFGSIPSIAFILFVSIFISFLC